MKRHKCRTVVSFALFLAGPMALDARAGSQETSKAVLTVQRPSGTAPLDMRVSVQYINSKTAEVLQVLAKAAGLTLELPQAPLSPVTITLTNVRLRTALDAICDTASCTWRLEGTTLKVASAAAPPGGSSLPPMVSIAVEEVSVRDVFRAIGAAINVPVVIEGNVERPPLTVKFTNSHTPAVLDYMCKMAGCTWEFDGASLRVRFKAP